MAACLVIIALVSIYTIVMRRAQQDAAAGAAALTVNLSTTLADQVSRTIQTVDLVMQEAARGIEGSGFTPELTEMLHDLPQIRAMVVTDGAGRVRQSSEPRLVGFLIDDRDWFRALRLSGQTQRLGAPEAGRYLAVGARSVQAVGLWSIPLARARRGPRGEFEGAPGGAAQPRSPDRPGAALCRWLRRRCPHRHRRGGAAGARRRQPGGNWPAERFRRAVARTAAA